MRNFAYKLLSEGRRGGAMPELPDSSELALTSAGLKPHSAKARFLQAKIRLPLAVASLRSAKKEHRLTLEIPAISPTF